MSRSIRGVVAATTVCTILISSSGAIAEGSPPEQLEADHGRPEAAAEPLPLEEPEQEQKVLSTSRSPATNRFPDRPSYVRTLDTLLGKGELSWLELGVEHRSRYEIRDDFFRVALESDDQFFTRTRAYVGVREVLDPLRLAFEFQDSRVFDSEFPETTRAINENDILQAFGELHFARLLGERQPLSVRVGRMSFDAVDRRLLARNRFRNTTNAFDGGRVRLGDESSVWELDVFLTQPVEREKRSLDSGDDDRLFGGVNGYWRGWGRIATVEPYYFLLDEDRKGPERPDREIHTLGVHVFGLIGDSGFDYDVNVTFQVGESGRGEHRAFAAHAEAAQTFDLDWKPRLAAWFNYASGDEDPDDDDDERFDPLFGAAHAFYGFSDLFSWQNLINPALYLAMQPIAGLRVDGGYRLYWLASDKDAFVRAGQRDPSGTSSDFIGQEFDVRARYKIFEHADLDVGYAHFIPGSFVEEASESTEDSDFFYASLTLQL